MLALDSKFRECCAVQSYLQTINETRQQNGSHKLRLTIIESVVLANLIRK